MRFVFTPLVLATILCLPGCGSHFVARLLEDPAVTAKRASDEAIAAQCDASAELTGVSLYNASLQLSRCNGIASEKTITRLQATYQQARFDNCVAEADHASSVAMVDSMAAECRDFASAPSISRAIERRPSLAERERLNELEKIGPNAASERYSEFIKRHADTDKASPAIALADKLRAKMDAAEKTLAAEQKRRQFSLSLRAKRDAAKDAIRQCEEETNSAEKLLIDQYLFEKRYGYSNVALGRSLAGVIQRCRYTIAESKRKIAEVERNPAIQNYAKE